MEISRLEEEYLRGRPPDPLDALPREYAMRAIRMKLEDIGLRMLGDTMTIKASSLASIREKTTVELTFLDEAGAVQTEAVAFYHRPARMELADGLKAIEDDAEPHELPKVTRQLIFLEVGSADITDGGKPVGVLTPETYNAAGEDAQRVILRSILAAWGVFLPPLFSSEKANGRSPGDAGGAKPSARRRKGGSAEAAATPDAPVTRSAEA